MLADIYATRRRAGVANRAILSSARRYADGSK